MTQKKFLCIQRSQTGECPPPSPADMEAMYAKFMNWKEKFADNIVDMGGKLNMNASVVRSDSTSDGPFVEAKEIAGGFMIIAAADMEEAKLVVKESPGVAMPGSSVEIREISTP